jgi:hypothetical protein
MLIASDYVDICVGTEINDKTVLASFHVDNDIEITPPQDYDFSVSTSGLGISIFNSCVKIDTADGVPNQSALYIKNDCDTYDTDCLEIENNTSVGLSINLTGTGSHTISSDAGSIVIDPYTVLHIDGNVEVDGGDIIAELAQAVVWAQTLGSETDGDWRIIPSGGNLLVQKFVTDTWTTKQTFS